MEDEEKVQERNGNEKEKTKIERIKSFAHKHGKKIVVGGAVAIAVSGAYILLRNNPDAKERILFAVHGFFDGQEESEIIDVTDLSDSELDSLLEETSEVTSESADIDLSETFSARRIGNMTGDTARRINALLKDNGFMEGEPGYYRPTTTGEPYCIEKADDTGYGGYAAKGWGWLEWSKDIIPLLGLKDPEEHLREVNENRAMAGLEPIKKIA